MTGTEAAPLVFELHYRREAYRKVGNSLVRDEEKDQTLPLRPPGFQPLKGAHGLIAERADELNNVQRRSGFMHYFFFPEIANTPINHDHCVVCRRLERRDAERG